MANRINLTTRREVMKTGLYAAGAVALGPYTRILGANDEIRIAVIGFRGRGGGLMSSFERIDGVKVVALCDVDQGVLDQEAAKRPGVFATQDMRYVMDRQDVDAVVFAAPNHWHALVTVWACQAGKDVYIEKPVSHSIWEGRKMVEAARKYGRVVAAGFQNRSDAGLVPFMQYLHGIQRFRGVVDLAVYLHQVIPHGRKSMEIYIFCLIRLPIDNQGFEPKAM